MNISSRSIDFPFTIHSSKDPGREEFKQYSFTKTDNGKINCKEIALYIDKDKVRIYTDNWIAPFDFVQNMHAQLYTPAGFKPGKFNSDLIRFTIKKIFR